MIDFKPITLQEQGLFTPYLQSGTEHGCEYSFVNLFAWGRQQAAIVEDQLVIFSQYNRKSVYAYPMGTGSKKAALEAIIEDAKQRGIPCRLVGLNQDDCAQLETLFPGKLHYHFDRDSFDYVYNINDLAELGGRKYQRKRNHLNRFRQTYPEHTLEPITPENLHQVQTLADRWFALRLQENPHGDFHMERAALHKVLSNYEALALEGLLLRTCDGLVAMTIGSRLRHDTFDVHFEKALDIADGAYPAINNGFARYLREKYPQVLYLNREDDMGLEGLRKAKLSYYPDHMVEKHWACLLEDGYDY